MLAITQDRWFPDRIANRIQVPGGESQWPFFDGNYQEFETDQRKRLGEKGAAPTRFCFKAPN